jgi:hypothetical protein
MAFKRKSRRKGVSLIKSKSSVVDGIKFKSQLEVYAYKELQKAQIKFKYEEDKFSLISGFLPISESWEFRYKKFVPVQTAIRSITYTPDFTCPNMRWVIETKGRPNESFPLRWKLFKRYIHSTGKPTLLFLPTNRSQVDVCIEQILKL